MRFESFDSPSSAQCSTGRARRHDIGEGEANIFVETADPARTFRTIRQHLSPSQLEDMRAAYRRFDDPEYTTLWPERAMGKFTAA